MSNIAIRVDRISKRYKIGVAKQRHDTLRDQLTESFRSLFRRNGRLSPASVGIETIWSLQDVSFEVRQGEVLAWIFHTAGDFRVIELMEGHLLGRPTGLGACKDAHHTPAGALCYTIGSPLC
jgi:ABC-type polysaccharide/polyol phosphate transport system ATPase subunit